MTAIVLVVILALIAFLNGDNSGVVAIAKIIGGIFLFIAVGYICIFIMDNPLIIFGVIAVIVLIAILSSKANNENTKPQSKESNVIKDISNSNIVSDYINKQEVISDFQKELQENTKTPEQVNNENWIKEKESIIKTAQNDYDNIKNKLINQAQSGQYKVINNQRLISINFYSSYLLICIHREYYYNPTGKIGTSSYNKNEKVSYYIDKNKQYKLYVSTVKKLASEDNIGIYPFFTEVDTDHKTENKINLPYTYKHAWKVPSHKIKAYLKCTVKY